MKFPIFAYNSNPKIDRPIISKSRNYIDGLVADGLAIWLAGGRSAQTLPPAGTKIDAKDDSNLRSNGGSGTLTMAEMVHNGIGLADKGKRPLMGCELRAIAKVQNYPASFADRIVSTPA